MLIPLELAICETAIRLRHRGALEFHGYSIAKAIKHQSDARLLTAYGTLYRALDRLQKMGLLESRREDPQIAADESRPGRRLYTLTAAGELAVAQARKAAATRTAGIRERVKKPATA
jgi:PadR family transcriptional regulator